MFQKLIVAKVTRINDVLRINSSPIVGVLIFGAVVIPISIAVLLIATDDNGIFEYMVFIIPILFFGFFFIYQYLSAINSRDMTISKRLGIDILIGNDRNTEHLKIKTPGFIKLSVEPKKHHIKVTIGMRRQTIASYRLENEMDLTRLVDGIMEILNLELESTKQQEKVDILTFVAKSKK